ncbi:High frequency lysogenization protein HflD [Arsenophonus endosymbiont of Aleurodicus floccissimus]|uniref:high frequency lysogenization protein HflD n=1 Tax=Arsenophonus endosymbiont of Aleurodicus floccissimus TaxID=2152761 RepID=UPI000E6AEE85|nr:high frequency lysogenization protein HflD [Arsenophonus endosymbiont of Aleurodicus floccissimus]SPP31400.1 High frequency lysogenization protein HflD [Arsenophonus endosymbiont of Aleurodicus floccissimus]
MSKNFYDITLAFAGICQACRLVQQLAHEGEIDDNTAEVMINSTLNINPTSTLEVYGNSEANLRVGLNTLLTILTASNNTLSSDLTRYLLSLIGLERRLRKNLSASDELKRRIELLQQQKNYFEPMSSGIFNALAGIYVDVISPIGPRIQVTGSPDMLQNSSIQAKVRALLFTGIRSAVLWQQVGGSRLQLMFSRQRLITQAKEILAHC